MNVNDFDVTIPDGDMLLTIFNHQRDLMEKYHIIEEANVRHWIPTGSYTSPGCTDPKCLGECGLAHTSKTWRYGGRLDINDRASQLRLKDFCWRVTEEITEATLALAEGESHRTHFEEELIDALHFTVELCCLSGVEPSDVKFEFKSFSLDTPMKIAMLPGHIRIFCYDTVEALGEAANTLKLKPWKTTAMLTDGSNYRRCIIKAFNNLVMLLSAAGFTKETATAMYLKKNAVNQFRQRSNY